MPNKKILIVEDDPDVRLGMQIRLEANHYETFFAGDVESALPAAQKHTPDLILLDLGLPGGGGFKAMENVKADPALAAIPIIIVSGRTGQETRAQALKGARRPSSKSRWITKSSWLSSGKRSAQTKQRIQNLGRHRCRDKNNTTNDCYIGTPLLLAD